MEYYTKKGNLVTFEEYCRLSSDADYRIIGREETDDYLVSTVWLGLDHSYDSSEILIFETMVFKNDGQFEDLICERYSTEEAAKEGHKRIADEWIRNKITFVGEDE